jgi:hypothetical protein
LLRWQWRGPLAEWVRDVLVEVCLGDHAPRDGVEKVRNRGTAATSEIKEAKAEEIQALAGANSQGGLSRNEPSDHVCTVAAGRRIAVATCAERVCSKGVRHFPTFVCCLMRGQLMTTGR